MSSKETLVDPTKKKKNKGIVIAVIVTCIVIFIVLIILLIVILSNGTGNGVGINGGVAVNTTPKAPNSGTTVPNTTYTQTLTNAEIQQIAQQNGQTASSPTPPVLTSTSVIYNSNSLPQITQANAAVIIEPPGYERYDFVTFEGGDLVYRADLAGRIGDLAALCNMRGSECVGFVSNGQLKYKVADKRSWFQFSDKPGDGLYLKR